MPELVFDEFGPGEKEIHLITRGAAEQTIQEFLRACRGPRDGDARIYGPSFVKRVHLYYMQRSRRTVMDNREHRLVRCFICFFSA